MIRLALIEDDEKIRNYLAALIERTHDFALAAALGSAEEGIDFFSHGNMHGVELMMSDIELPGKTGIEFIEWFKPQFPSVQVMVLSSYDDSDRVFGALKAGATGYILKNTPAGKLIEALQDLRKGGSPMSSQIARMVVEAFAAKDKGNTYFQELSRREQEILEQLRRGFRYKEIADQLFVSIDTVRTHIRNIYEKLQVNSRVDALKKTGFI